MFRFLCLVKFWCKVFKSLYMDISKIIEKGNVFVIVIVCSVFSFLVRRSVIVIMFMSEVQNICCQMGVFVILFDVRVFIIIVFELVDVIKKMMIIVIVMNDSIEENGKCFRKLNRVSDIFC